MADRKTTVSDCQYTWLDISVARESLKILEILGDRSYVGRAKIEETRRVKVEVGLYFLQRFVGGVTRGKSTEEYNSAWSS